MFGHYFQYSGRIQTDTYAQKDTTPSILKTQRLKNDDIYKNKDVLNFADSHKFKLNFRIDNFIEAPPNSYTHFETISRFI